MEKYDISYIQSRTILSLLQERRYEKIERKVLAIGDPYYEETNFSYLDFDESVLASNFRSGAINFSVKNIYGTLGYENWSKLPGSLKEIEDSQSF